MTAHRTIYSTGFIEPWDEPQPPGSTGCWDDVWARFPADTTPAEELPGRPQDKADQ